MPGKSRHSKGKHTTGGKRRKTPHSSLPVAAEQPSVPTTGESVGKSEVSASSVGVPAPSAVAPQAKYLYIASEIRRIGILAGIMLVVLVVLALFLG